MFNQNVALAKIESSSPASASVWDRVYAFDPYAIPTQSKFWAKAVLAGSGSREVSRHYCFSDGQEAVLPLFRRNILPLAIAVLNSPPPAWGFGGVLALAPLTKDHLIEILDDCSKLPGAAISIRPNPLLATEWRDAALAKGWSILPKNSHVLSLDGSFECVWKSRFSSNARNKIRRAEKANVKVELGNNEHLVADFVSLFRRSIDRWARKQNEFEWLAQMRGHFRDSSKKFRLMAEHASQVLLIGIARHHGKPVAGAILLVDRNAHYTRGAMDERFIGKTYANYLLQAKMIERSCELKCGHYHMGETGNSRSLAQFKGQFGAVPVGYAELRHERLPVYSAERTVRSGIKRLIGFSDV
ncbi:MAG: GNAT family N-acetyltransferase [Roseibium sp.]